MKKYLLILAIFLTALSANAQKEPRRYLGLDTTNFIPKLFHDTQIPFLMLMEFTLMEMVTFQILLIHFRKHLALQLLVDLRLLILIQQGLLGFLQMVVYMLQPQEQILILLLLYRG